MHTLEGFFSNSLLEKNFLKLLSNPEIKVVSFDIFDTLFFRKCDLPTTVFEIMGKHQEILAKFDTASTFGQYRQNAEKAARKLLLYKEDITLDEIYTQLPLSPQERKRFQAIELETEKGLLVLNPQLQRWIQLATDASKKVILLSDMYLNSSQVEELALCKLSHRKQIFKVYMSNECKTTKATGNLFIHAMRELELKPHELLHIGDNQRTDIVIANSFGIQTLYYGQNQEQKERMRHEAFYLQESLSSGNHVRYLSSLLNPYEDTLQTFYFDIGASIFAPLLWEFSHWLADIVERFGMEQLSFIMREGALFQKCFTALYPHIATNLLYASRKSTNFLTLSSEDIGSANFHMYKNFTIQDLYTNFFLKIENETIKPYAHKLCTEAQSIIFNDQTLLTLAIEDLQSRASTISDTLQEQKQLLLDYLQSLLITDTTALIDFGGSGTVIKRLLEVLPQELQPKTNMLLYEHAQGYQKLSDKHILAFLPYTKKTAQAIQSIHRTPEFIEILLNGLHETALNYAKRNTKTVPYTYLPKTNQKNLTQITHAFENGIKLFFELARTYKLPPKSYDREELTYMLARLIELPTHTEAKFLGELEYDEGKASHGIYALIDDTKRYFIQKVSIDKTHQEFLKNPIKYRREIPWMEGVITQLFPSYLLQYHGASTNPNQEIIERLLKQLDASQQKQIMVYGAGELFIQLLPYLQERKVTIEALIDSRAEINTFEVKGYKVVALAEALATKNQATIMVASGVFARNIHSLIQNFSDTNHKIIQIIF